MASLAEITLAVRDRASAEIAHVARELRTLPDTHSVNLRVQGGGGLGGHARDLDTITRHARTADGTLKSLGGTALSVASGLGFGLGAAELGQYVIGAGQAANQLSRTNEVTKILAGTTEEYRQVVALARQGQRDFGGSFDAQLAGLGGLIPLAREAGVELAYLDNISKRLNLKSPENGPGGARIALSEFLSGSGAESSLSLRERYEIPKEKIEHLTQPGVTNEEKLRGLDQILNQMRFNNEALTASTNLSAASWTRLGASVDNAKVKFGGMISEGLAPAAEAVGQLLSGFQGGSEQGVLRYAQASLSLVGAKRELTAAEKEQILGLAQWLGLVTPAVAAADAHTAATRASATETERHAALQNMAAVAGGQLASEELEIERATRAAAAATREAAAAFRKETADAASNEAQSRLAAQAKEALTNRATTAAKAILNSGNASTAAIGRMASLTGIGFGLLNMYVQVERAARAANAAMSGITGATDAYAQIYDRNGGRAGNKLVVEKGKAAAGVADAERDAIMATGTYAQKLALLNRELADLEKRAPKSEAAIRKRTERDSLVLSAPKGGKGSDPTKVGGLDDRLATAGKTDVAELAHWRTRIKGMEQGSNEWKAARAKILGLEERIANSDTRATLKAGKTAQRDAEDIRRREFALLDDPGKRRALQAEQATLPKGSLRAREIAAEIATINERIASQ
ncbi:MAG TPA: hypothetical protein VLA19_28620, partial [Herpetosiphonaceae bacterium]|nr:hypothetical protein [Herpetosiphonaceae bacterium]